MAIDVFMPGTLRAAREISNLYVSLISKQLRQVGIRIPAAQKNDEGLDDLARIIERHTAVSEMAAVLEELATLAESSLPSLRSSDGVLLRARMVLAKIR
jgi:hypothetical protein